MAKKCMMIRETRRKYPNRVRNRCKICGRPRVYATLRVVPDLLPRDRLAGQNSGRYEVLMVDGWSVRDEC